MEYNNKKKGQGLPLNTIIIAILVIIVMLVIVVFFTSRMITVGNETSSQTDNIRDCSPDNPALNVGYKNIANVEGDSCPDNSERIPIAPNCCGVRR